MENSKIILTPERFDLTIERLCHQLIEKYDDFQNTCLIGIQEGGVLMGNRIHQRLVEILGFSEIEYGKLDITFYRDDFRTRQKPLKASTTEMAFLLEEKRVVLLDDVLYTGRSVHAAMTALQHYGRPANVELMVMVDRRFNRHLPVQSDYVGLTIDSFDKSYVKVEWAEIEGKDQIKLLGKQ
ncbi:MAG: bifunctional pyr operon transcriptional regulator/uracil phosphoribosyltransferase PyrR [Bacteroidota bacterium]